MASKLFLLSTFVIAAFVGVRCQQLPTNLYSTRTFYDAVRGSGVRSQGGCTPVALWTLIRAGAHYPSVKEMQKFSELDELRSKILENHNKWNSGDLSEEVLKSLEEWSLDVEPSKARRLIESAQGDLTSFLRRLQTQFPRLLHPSQAKSHNVQHNSSPRSVETFNIITSTLYNIIYNSTGIKNFEESFETSTCPKLNQVLRNADAKAQEFVNSNVMRETVLNVSRRLGFNRLNYNLIKTAYELCTFDRAISADQTSPWCSIFTANELEVFEYREDIESYYTSGHGNRDHAQIGCDFIRVFLQNFSVYKTNANVNIQVADGLLIRAALAALGLAENEPPVNSDNFSTASSRLWKNSFLTPFTGNLVAVLNECRVGKRQTNTVSLFINEVPISFPSCGNTIFCELSRFESFYQGITRPSFCKRNYC